MEGTAEPLVGAPPGWRSKAQAHRLRKLQRVFRAGARGVLLPPPPGLGRARRGDALAPQPGWGRNGLPAHQLLLGPALHAPVLVRRPVPDLRPPSELFVPVPPLQHGPDLRPLPALNEDTSSYQASGPDVGFEVFDTVINSFQREGFATAFAALLDKADLLLAVGSYDAAAAQRQAGEAGEGGHHAGNDAPLQQDHHVELPVPGPPAHAEAVAVALAAENVQLLRENCQLDANLDLIKKQSEADRRNYEEMQAAAQQDVLRRWAAAPWTRTLRAYLSAASDGGRDSWGVVSEFVDSLDEQSMEEYFGGAADDEQMLLDIQEQMCQYIEAYWQLAGGGP